MLAQKNPNVVEIFKISGTYIEENHFHHLVYIDNSLAGLKFNR
jgi:hypothetical protein